MTEETQLTEEDRAPASMQAMENAQLVPIDYLVPNPHQPRAALDDRAMEELVTSVRDIGILEPLVVARKGRKRYIVIAGHRRLAAAQKAELPVVPCIVRDLSNDDFLMYSLIENLQRTDLTAMEESQALRQLIDQFGWTYREAAARIGKSATFVNDRLLLIDLYKDVREALVTGHISLKKAIELGKIPNERMRARLLKKGNEGTLDEFKELIEEEISRVKKGRKAYEKWDVLPELREFSEKTEGVRIYKDRLSIKFTSTSQLLDTIAKLMELLKEGGDLDPSESQ